MTQYSGKVIRKTPVTPTQASASGVWKLNEQAAAIRNNSWPIAGVPDPISRSVRLRSSASAYFNRTPAISGTRTKATISLWVKRGTLGARNPLVVVRQGATDYFILEFQSDDTLQAISVTSSSVNTQLVTTSVYRDPSAWYHIVFTYDSTVATPSSSSIYLSVNGVKVTALSTATYPSQNTNIYYNIASVEHDIGKLGNLTTYADCYLTEINSIDGQALTPSSFGTTDAFTGAWIPMAYTGTYGTNGFYLNFKDNTSTTTLGYDYSGNANNWTANNISLTSGVTYDSMLDVPTPWVGYSTTTDTSAVTRGNYSVLNPLDSGATISDGNLTFTGPTGYATTRSSVGMTSGKWYWEIVVNAVPAGLLVGIANSSASLSQYLGQNANGWSYCGDGNKYTNGSGSAYGATYTTNDVIGVAFDADAGTLVFYKNNTSQGTAFSSLTSGPYFPAIGDGSSGSVVSCYVNFGQRPLSYTPPSGFKTLCTTNLPTPTILNGAEYMAATTYTGNNTTNVITNGGNNTTATTFRPDLVWMKCRSNVVSHVLDDSVRGPGLDLFSNLTNAETSTGILTSFNSNGFSLGPDGGGAENGNGLTYVAWQWKAGGTPAVTNTAGSITSTVSAGTTQGFSVVTYTGTGSNATVGHGLGVAPAMMIVKSRSNGGANWNVWHKSLSDGNSYLELNTTVGQQSNVGPWNSTPPSSSVFYIGSGWSPTNGVGSTHVAYLFAQVAGYSAFGSYTGNGSTDGPFVYCGFRPRWVMIKLTSSAGGSWVILDTSRDTYNAETNGLFPNLSDAESSGYLFDGLSNGFKVRNAGAGQNSSGATYIYAAFAENPFKYSNAR